MGTEITAEVTVKFMRLVAKNEANRQRDTEKGALEGEYKLKEQNLRAVRIERREGRTYRQDRLNSGGTKDESMALEDMGGGGGSNKPHRGRGDVITYGTKPLLVSQDEEKESGLSRRPRGKDRWAIEHVVGDLELGSIQAAGWTNWQHVSFERHMVEDREKLGISERYSQGPPEDLRPSQCHKSIQDKEQRNFDGVRVPYSIGHEKNQPYNYCNGPG
ncbi:hypothetical protein EDC04DRAFT_2614363 [Pisolithus marmoratus]|nr:hypothetical protein EDC04DRAFT_2614363 [Pisolithus marmoratus]